MNSRERSTFESPSVHPMGGLPNEVTICEVGPRDGLQAENKFIATEDKIRYIHALRKSGLQRIEPTSLVSPRWVPQFVDASEVLNALDLNAMQYPVLVPNLVGLRRATEANVRSIAVFVSATERFATENLSTTRQGALDTACEVVREAQILGIEARGYVSMCFGDPWEGPVKSEAVAEATRMLLDAGVYEVALGDTIGVGTPGQVVELIEALEVWGVPVEKLALHFHDTFGQALANVHAGLIAGVTTYDASTGGIGGCPFARSATGNLATEDLLWMLMGLGISTGIALQPLVAAGQWMSDKIGKPPSRVARALSASSVSNHGQSSTHILPNCP